VLVEKEKKNIDFLAFKKMGCYKDPKLFWIISLK
jgi:hypothetical protein